MFDGVFVFQVNPSWITPQWSREDIVSLAMLWMQENPRLSASAIGRELNRSKNAVVSKTRSIGLPQRGSPLRAAGEWVTPERMEAIRDGAKQGLNWTMVYNLMCSIPGPPIPKRDTMIDYCMAHTDIRVRRKVSVKPVRRTQPMLDLKMPPSDLPLDDEPLGGRCLWTEGERFSWRFCNAFRSVRPQSNPPVLRPFCAGHTAIGLQCK